jgi:hypothetical protein
VLRSQLGRGTRDGAAGGVAIGGAAIACAVNETSDRFMESAS